MLIARITFISVKRFYQKDILSSSCLPLLLLCSVNSSITHPLARNTTFPSPVFGLVQLCSAPGPRFCFLQQFPDQSGD